MDKNDIWHIYTKGGFILSFFSHKAKEIRHSFKCDGKNVFSQVKAENCITSSKGIEHFFQWRKRKYFSLPIHFGALVQPVSTVSSGSPSKPYPGLGLFPDPKVTQICGTASHRTSSKTKLYSTSSNLKTSPLIRCVSSSCFCFLIKAFLTLDIWVPSPLGLSLANTAMVHNPLPLISVVSSLSM